MKRFFGVYTGLMIGLFLRFALQLSLGSAQEVVPPGVEVVWEVGKAYRETTTSRERICINGLWRWQPAEPNSQSVPTDGWGYFKVPGCWPGITDYMQKDCQRVYAHPKWRALRLSEITAAWYQREITIPSSWTGRKLILYAEYLNSYADVYLDGELVGSMQFPAGELDLTRHCRPGETHVLSLLVVAMPLRGVILAFTDSNAARQVRGRVARRGLCGDLYLMALPQGVRLADVRVETSVRQWLLTIQAKIEGLAPGQEYRLRVEIRDDGKLVQQAIGEPFDAAGLQDGVLAWDIPWQPEKLWDLHTPSNQYEATVSLTDAEGRVLDTAWPIRFGFREFWIEGRDFYLNGSRIFLCAVPLDNAQVGAAWASYDAAKESLRRLQSFGINFVYTHNYDCRPGSHLSFNEILRAADDVGMLVAFSQPHFSDYDWSAEKAEATNGYAEHAAFYVRIAANHPSVVMYSMSHNATGYSEDMNPDLIDGIHEVRDPWSLRNTRSALRAEAIVRRLDPTRIVYHHSSGNLSSMHTSNFYPNWVPIQEMSDWFEHWSTVGVKPFFTCEYGAPFTWDWALYRGWYKGAREFGSAVVPWDFCLAEWNAQFLGDRAYKISEQEKRNLRWEAEQFRAGRLWHRWDYPHQLGSSDFDERYPILAEYLTDNWRAFRTWEVSAISPWEYHVYWKMRPGLNRNRLTELPTDWHGLQRPGFSPDYLEQRFERMDMAYEMSDWVPTLAAQAMYRNNAPLLAYIGGKPSAFTSKDHIFLPGEVVEKQIIVINNSRMPVSFEGTVVFSSGAGEARSLPAEADSAMQRRPANGRIYFSDSVRGNLETGNQVRIPVRIQLDKSLNPGEYRLEETIRFSNGQTQQDRLSIHVLPLADGQPLERSIPQGVRIAVFDPVGETTELLRSLGVRFQAIDAKADLTSYQVLILGKKAITCGGELPNLRLVRDGLKVIVFEQTAEALEKRLGFRVIEYGLRKVFPRIPNHPYLDALAEEHLRDWRGEATLLPPRLDYQPSDRYAGVPTVRWCGLEVPRLWRCGNRGNVASVLIEKPTVGDFLPVLDGGFSLQYSPLLEYREGKGMVLFCQLDVTGRTAEEPAARKLVENILRFVCRTQYPVCPERTVVYVGDPLAKDHLELAGIPCGDFQVQRLGPDQVLVVGPGGRAQIAPHAQAIAEWLKGPGHVVAVELESQEIYAALGGFLGGELQTTRREYISGFFEPRGFDSVFAGIAPADIHNKDPRLLPLVSGGLVEILGDGVLAQAAQGRVVFCQLAPYRFIRRPRDVPEILLESEDPAEGSRSALVTLATVPWAQIGQKLPAGEVGKTYTFACFVKAIDKPVTVRLEVERAGTPWDRAVRGQDVEIPPGRWIEIHVTFEVERPYPEGWQAYVHCGPAESRLRMDGFRLYEGPYVPRDVSAGVDSDRATGHGQGRNLLNNPGFEAGLDPWFFNWRTEQQNLRKTFRRSSFMLNRVLGNLGVRARTPLLDRFVEPERGSEAESILRNGDFRFDETRDSVPDQWSFSANPKEASCTLESPGPELDQPCVRLSWPESLPATRGSVMLAQYDVAAVEGQWYRISLKAKASGPRPPEVTLALQDTKNWQSFFQYQRFMPREQWKEFVFYVRASKTSPSQNRFQIWYSSPGTIWLAGVSIRPCPPPWEGRWRAGLYLDIPQEWDDPYRFFRW